MTDEQNNEINNSLKTIARLMERYFIAQTTTRRTRPDNLLNIRVFIDGDKWCALHGDDLQSGLCGFGDSPAEAILNFDHNFYKKVGE